MYVLDYLIAIQDLLVPDKRTDNIVAFNNGLVGNTSQLHINLFSTYKNANFSLTEWSAGTYVRNYLVRYGKSIYISAIAGNTDEPTFTDNWVLVSENYLGSDFRLAIRGEKLILEYALNVWFETTFRQPPSVSDIYITTNTILNDVFRVGDTEFASSKVSDLRSTELVGNSYTFSAQYNMTIHVPTAVYNALATTTDAREAIFRNFADRYVNAGLTYNIITY